ncbi:MAG: hydrogenase maturation protease [Pseudomonadota bacterium]
MTNSARLGELRDHSVLLFAYGNPSRGDDAVGPLLLEHLEKQASAAGWRHIELLSDFQLQIEHALDLTERELVLFADASVACSAPFDFREIMPCRDNTYTSHAMSPQSVLEVYGRTLHSPPPPSFLLSIRGEAFELGASLTPAAEHHLEAACAFIEALCAEPSADIWRVRTGETANAPVLK